jgi:hypothetical protein
MHQKPLSHLTASQHDSSTHSVVILVREENVRLKNDDVWPFAQLTASKSEDDYWPKFF